MAAIFVLLLWSLPHICVVLIVFMQQILRISAFRYTHLSNKKSAYVVYSHYFAFFRIRRSLKYSLPSISFTLLINSLLILSMLLIYLIFQFQSSNLSTNTSRYYVWCSFIINHLETLNTINIYDTFPHDLHFMRNKMIIFLSFLSKIENRASQ